MLLPSGWLSGAEGGMVVAVQSLADGKAQGFKSILESERGRRAVTERRGS